MFFFKRRALTCVRSRPVILPSTETRTRRAQGCRSLGRQSGRLNPKNPEQKGKIFRAALSLEFWGGQRCQRRIVRNAAGSFACTSAWVCVFWWGGGGWWEAEKETQNLNFSKNVFLNFSGQLGLCHSGLSSGCGEWREGAAALLLWLQLGPGLQEWPPPPPPAQQLWLPGSGALAQQSWCLGLLACVACGLFPAQGLNPIPALAGGFFTPEPPAKPRT